MSCPTLDKRRAEDARIGKETTAKAAAFVQRTCRCDECVARRAGERAGVVRQLERDSKRRAARRPRRRGGPR